MKLFLTSAGLVNKNIANKFLDLVDKPGDSIRIVFVPTAARTEEELKYVNESKQELLDLGISEQSILTFNLDSEVPYREIADYDVIYICGGNTFYLLKKVREVGFDKTIKDFVENGGLYLGVSAGSILAGPNIDIASPFDENDVNLKDLTGLHLTDIIVSPHYCDEEKDIIDNFKKKSQYKVITLTDEQALLVADKNIKVIK